MRGGAIAQETPPPSRLLIATPRRVDCVRMPEPGSEQDGSLVRIVVVNEDSTTLRSRLRSAGFDFLVRRPVHPEALRLLLLRVLYRGDHYITALGADRARSRLALPLEDHRVAVLDWARGRITRRFEGHTAPLQALLFADEGRVLISAGRDARIFVWRLEPHPEGSRL